jgi:hypothetical protein
MKLVFLTDHDINKLMGIALTMGVRHWCDTVTVSSSEFKGWFSDAIAAGHVLKLHDSKDDEEYRLTFSKLAEGLERYAKKQKLPLTNDDRLDFDGVNAVMADYVVQYAIFGEVRYE